MPRLRETLPRNDDNGGESREQKAESIKRKTVFEETGDSSLTLRMTTGHPEYWLKGEGSKH